MIDELNIPQGVKREIVIVHDTPETAERVIRLQGEGAEVVVDEIFLTGGVKSALSIIHESKGTFSRIHSRGVLDKNEFAEAHAKIVIPQSAIHCDSHVSQEFLLLDESARVDALPALEIEADDVKASHRAAIAPLDDDKLFYVMSRGFSEGDARSLLVRAFLRVPSGFEHMVKKWQ